MPPPPTLAKPTPRLPARTRIFVGGHPIPVYLENPYYTGKKNIPTDSLGNPRFVQDEPASTAMAAAGCEVAWMVYNGDFNRVAWWAAKDTNGEYQLLPEPTVGEDANHCAPPDLAVARAMSRLAADPQHFRPNLVKPYPLTMFDIENEPSVSVNVATVAEQIAVLNNWTATARAMKSAAADMEVFVYGDAWMYLHFLGTGTNDPALLAAFAEYRAAVNGMSASLYLWDLEAGDARRWEADLSRCETALTRFCPEFARSKIAVLNPRYQTMGARWASLNNKPVPLATWQSMLEACIEQGWWVWVWQGPGAFDDVTPHLKMACGYAEG